MTSATTTAAALADPGQPLLPVRILRPLLVADAMACAALGVAALTAASPLAGLLGVPSALLVASGIFLVLWALATGIAARQPDPAGDLLTVLAAGNVAWAVGSMVLLMVGLAEPGLAGTTILFVLATGVLLVAAVELAGRRRRR